MAGLEYGGLRSGSNPNAPLTGRKNGASDDTLEIHPGGRVVAKDGVTIPVFPGTPTDADFDETPADGTLAIGNDGTNDGVYVRVGGAWKHVDVA